MTSHKLSNRFNCGKSKLAYLKPFVINTNNNQLQTFILIYEHLLSINTTDPPLQLFSDTMAHSFCSEESRLF